LDEEELTHLKRSDGDKYARTIAADKDGDGEGELGGAVYLIFLHCLFPHQHF
jgi:hypothetical protein